MKCAVVQDLLPNYCDGLCSAETSLEIEKHIADCPVCSSILKDHKSEVKSEKEVKNFPEKPFKKLHKKLSHHKFLVISLVVCLFILACWNGFLIFVKTSDRYPFFSAEIMLSSGKAEKVVENICSGNIDEVTDALSFRYDDRWQTAKENFDDIGEGASKLARCNELLNEYYSMIKDKKTDISAGESYYSEPVDGGRIMCSEFIVSTEGFPAVKFTVGYEKAAYGDDTMYLSCQTKDSDDKFNIFINNELGFMLDPELLPAAMDDREIRAINIDRSAQNIGYYFIDVNYYDEQGYDEEYNNGLAERFMELNSKGIHCDKFFRKDLRYSREKGFYLVDIYAVFSDPDTGRQIFYMRTMRPADEKQFVVLEEFEPVIIDGGVSPETREMVENIF